MYLNVVKYKLISVPSKKRKVSLPDSYLQNLGNTIFEKMDIKFISSGVTEVIKSQHLTTEQKTTLLEHFIGKYINDLELTSEHYFEAIKQKDLLLAATILRLYLPPDINDKLEQYFNENTVLVCH